MHSPDVRRARAPIAATAALLVTGATLAGCRPAQPDTSTATTRPDGLAAWSGREADPVVLTGSEAGALTGAAPDRVVAFRAEGGRWVQIPVQVDERLDTTFGQIYGLGPGERIPRWSTVNVSVPINTYADPATFVGPDTNPALDADDEIVFMARDAGEAAGGLPAPAGTEGGGTQIEIGDPDDGSSTYAYLFRSDGSLDPSAATTYVDYAFRLGSGDYKATYKRFDGPNLENSMVTGATYRTHFSDRWLQDELYLTRGDRPAKDLADRMKYHINLLCVRNENTFNNDEGAFIVNKSGPVRGLRSYVGSNSGPLTQNTHLFYDRMLITKTDLRVHGIPNVGAALDLSREAVGMTFRNPSVPDGVTIDGRPDDVPTDPEPTWWTYHGTQGGIAVSSTVETNASQPAGTVYEDDFSGSTDAACTGDGESIGMAGGHFRSWIACTDPGSGCPGNYLRSQYRWVATPASVTPADLQQLAEHGLAPLRATATAY